MIGGAYDAYIAQFADRSARLGPPVLPALQLGDERQLVPLVGARQRQQPGEYVAAWRHVHDIFTAVGATNATWVWCPYADTEKRLQKTPLKPLYPGNRTSTGPASTATTGAGTPSTRSPGAASTNSSTRPTSDVTKKVAPSKPMMLGEFATSPYGGHKAAWIRRHVRKAARASTRGSGPDLVQHRRPWHRLAAGDLAAGRQSICRRDPQRHLRQQPFGELATSPIPPLR